MQIHKPRRRVLRTAIFAVVLFVGMSAIFLAVAYWAESSTIHAERDKIISSQQDLVATERTVISSKIDRLSDDLVYVRNTLELDGFDTQDHSDLIANWIAFADTQRIYDQIRFIDVEGNEVIRVNYHDDGSVSVPADELQNKADRYYFTESIGLESDQIYISRLDLNIEGDSIEQPIKPMIRLCIPCFDDAGTLRGIVCLNYLADDMLSVVDTVASAGIGKVSLINSDGYWLYNEADPDTAWAFMYDDRADESFANEYPDDWAQMQGAGEGSVITDDGLFAYTHILTSADYGARQKGYRLALDEGDWTVVARVPATGEYAELFSWGVPQILASLAYRYIIVLALTLALAIALAMVMEYRHFRKAQVQYFSEYDEMTGIFNRRAGLDRLDKAVKRRREDDGKISVCFIDVNGLKDVNDTFGHDAGDELILTVTGVIKRNIRDRDSLVRMGGDEFLVVFDGLDKDAAEKIWARIAAQCDELDKSGKLGYPLSASHGIAELTADMSPDEAIAQADDLMYAEKRIMKEKAGKGPAR